MQEFKHASETFTNLGRTASESYHEGGEEEQTEAAVEQVYELQDSRSEDHNHALMKQDHVDIGWGYSFVVASPPRKHASFLHKLRLDLHSVLHMTLQRRPTIMYCCAPTPRQLHQILVEPLPLLPLQLLLSLHGAGSRLQALPLYLRLSHFDLSICAFFKTWKRAGKRLEVCDELLVGTSSLLGFGRRLLDFGYEGGVLDLLLIFLGGGEGRVEIIWRGERDLSWTSCSRRFCARCCALLDWRLKMGKWLHVWSGEWARERETYHDCCCCAGRKERLWRTTMLEKKAYR